MARLFMLLTAAVAALAPAARSAPQQPVSATPPSLAGVWDLEFMGGWAPLGFRNERAVCWPGSERGVPAAGAAAPGLEASPLADGGAGDQIAPFGTFTAELTIQQSAAAVTISRKYGGSVASGELKGVYPTDGAESTNTSGDITTRTKSRWDAGVFVIEGDATTKGRAGVCRIRETFEIRADGSLAVTLTGDTGSGPATSRQRYRRGAPRGF